MPTSGIIEYPTALDTALTLIELLNNASSTLTAPIGVGDLLIPVAQPGKFSNSGIVTLTDSLTSPTKIEIFVYTSKSGSNHPGGRAGTCRPKAIAQHYFHGHHHLALRASSNLFASLNLLNNG